MFDFAICDNNQEHAAIVYKIIKRLHPPVSVAEDLRQELWLSIYSSLEKAKATCKNVNRANLYEYAMYRGLDFMERIQRKPDNDRLDMDDETVSAEQTDARDFLKARIGRLTAREKKIVKAIFWQGKTLLEIGNELGVTRERIRQIREDALAKLRDENWN